MPRDSKKYLDNFCYVCGSFTPNSQFSELLETVIDQTHVRWLSLYFIRALTLHEGLMIPSLHSRDLVGSTEDVVYEYEVTIEINLEPFTDPE